MIFLIAPFLLSWPSFGDSGVTEKLTNGFCVPVVTKKNCVRDIGKIDVSVIDEDVAKDLFRSFHNDPSLALKYKVDGCYARATRMAKAAEAKGIIFAKVFAEGQLRVLPPVPHYQYPVMWGFHVAPVVMVKKHDGSSELQVLDPSIFNKPVPLSEWKARLIEQPKLTASEDISPVLNRNLPNDIFKKPYRLPTKYPQPGISDLYFGSRFQSWERSRLQESKDSWDEEEVEAADSNLKAYSKFQAYWELKVAEPPVLSVPGVVK